MTPPNTAEVHDFPANLVWFDEDKIYYSIAKPNVPAMGKEELVEFMRRLRELVNNKKVCMIVKVNASDPLLNKEDRNWLAQQLEEVTAAMAVVHDSPMGRMVANLYFGIRPGKYPMKFFGSVEDAKQWIMQYLK